MRRADRQRSIVGRTLALGATALVTAVLTGCTAAPTAPQANPATQEADGVAGATRSATSQVQQAEALLVKAEDARVFAADDDANRRVAHEVPAHAPGALPTVVLTPRAQPYGLPDLERLGAAARRSPAVWDVVEPVVVEDGATLRLDNPGATLRLVSGRAGFTSIVGLRGTVALVGAPDAPLTITTVDPTTDEADTTTADGRGYVRAIGGRLDVTDVHLSDLGFWSGRTGGLSWTGNATRPSTGTATRTLVERSHYGMFAGRTDGLVVDGGAVRDNEVDGLLVHRRSRNVSVTGLESSGNGRNGVTVTAGARDVALRGVRSTANAGDGIRVDGSAPSVEATTAGAGTADPAAAAASTEPGRDFTVERCAVVDNGDSGITAAAATALSLVGNTVSGNRDGIVVRGAGAGPAPTQQRVTGNVVAARQFGIAVRDGTDDIVVEGNSVRAATVAVQVADARAELHDNVVESASRYGVSLTGAVSGSVVRANRLAGQGPVAVDMNRMLPGAAVTVADNDESAWSVDRDEVAYWSHYVADHPMVLLWLLILLVPFGAAMWTRRHRRATPTDDDPESDDEIDTAAIATTASPTTRGFRRHRREDVETTFAMPITRVTVVSSEPAGKQ